MALKKIVMLFDSTLRFNKWQFLKDQLHHGT